MGQTILVIHLPSFHVSCAQQQYHSDQYEGNGCTCSNHLWSSVGELLRRIKSLLSASTFSSAFIVWFKVNVGLLRVFNDWCNHNMNLASHSHW